MPIVKLHQNGRLLQQEVAPGSNLVVLAGTRKFDGLSYGCGMGKCTRCMVKVLSGGETLPEPNWKENKMLGDKIRDGYRLACQIYVHEDLELAQESAVRSRAGSS
ncbi:(2Fe-2S)-binding protein [Paenibacillus sp. 7124]|uniref:(2Fe-2S)-binding protein n=2 Tax=Paenibacillus TaxID=44249 RepID=A0A6M1PJI4_9BACL|nr:MULTISPECIES: 2Fe-2S iron-sulfur cluster-binding protein [Paenibacillus]AHV96311.1 ferredoxin [Paenibacillus sabinae T27]NGM82495.1 (2Fe-2S)-binding protein [Paenibacillus apii]NJJ39635.1 (2Fe-2S)-binding protein [Paenibacillus apii]